MDASYWKDVLVQALKTTRRWAAEQEQSTAALAALSEFHGRLSLLGGGGAGVANASSAASAAFGALREQPDALPLLHAKH
eukprot:6090117-Prymnesium_polylepis.3